MSARITRAASGKLIVQGPNQPRLELWPDDAFRLGCDLIAAATPPKKAKGRKPPSAPRLRAVPDRAE